MSIALHILSPEGTLVRADVTLVTQPGVEGPFTVLKDHAALITALTPWNIRYVEDGQEKFLAIRDGFVEVKDNVVKVCVEV
ncbi:MAG: F0F1 ATP synthase subunit epsilon [Bacteroidales bacterium]|nr:F0F1 ATP synthase subunit epsilon [Bacteroidales bacterium]